MARFGLIHGAWHGAWCWSGVAAALRALGHDAVAVDLPVDRSDATIGDYAGIAAADFGGGDPPIVVAHSMAGLVAPLVAGMIPARGLVYLAAILRRPGKSLADDRVEGLNRDISPPDFGKALKRDADGLTFWPDAASAAGDLFQDASQDTAAWAFARLRHQKGYWRDRSPQPDWPSVPAASLVCTEDRAVTPDWSRRVARDWLGVEPIEVPGAHSPHLTRPEALAALLDRLAGSEFTG